jgi:hypothetical protein
MDLEASATFDSLHSLRKRIGVSRQADEHPYEPVIDGIPSLSCPPRRQLFRRRLARRRDNRGGIARLRL